MGIVNLTDDSFFASSRCVNVESALERVRTLLDEGADIIDLGACSTRPGSVQVGEEEEWRRLAPVLTALKREFPDIRISIDTYWSSVVKKAYDLIGPFIVNDISAGEADPMMLQTVGSLGLTYVAMHMRGTPENMQSQAIYDDVTQEVASYFRKFAKKAEVCGVKEWILDPGFGFSKTLEQNYELLRNMSCLKAIQDGKGSQVRILVGVSRKSMVYKLLGISPEESLPATQVVHMAALQSGADILRVHDVAEAKRTIALFKALQGHFK